jgi:DNA invertase Pin-like site-specific DNA recombinase
MKPILQVALAAVVALLGLGAPAGAAQRHDAQQGPTELWRQYPLDAPQRGGGAQPQPPSGPAGPSPRPVGGGGSTGGGESPAGGPMLPTAVIVGGGILLLAPLAMLVAVGERRRRAGAPAAAIGVKKRRSKRGVERKPRSHGRGHVLAPPPAPTPIKPQQPTPAASPEPDTMGATARQKRAEARHGVRALGYTTVAGSEEPGSPRLREEAELIGQACAARGVTLTKLVQDHGSQPKSDLKRPGLAYALDRLSAAEFDCLVVTRLDRLVSSAASLGSLLRMLDERGTRLLIIDLELDTDTSAGRLAAEALARVGDLEREKLEQRTRRGLDAVRDRRHTGYPAVADRAELDNRIADMRSSGMTLKAIADTLNAEGVPTRRGGAEWRPSSVQAAAGYKRPNRKRRLSSDASAESSDS